MDIVALGEVLIDLTQTGRNSAGIPQLDANPGGAPANLAVAAARLGAKTAFVGRVGQDGFGTYLREVLTANGVDTRGLSVDPQYKTTLAVVTVNETGERDFGFYRDPSADTRLTMEHVPLELLEETRFFHFGSVSLTCEPGRSATLAAARKAKELGKTVTYDPNYRASLWPDQQTAVRQMLEALPLADILKVSDEELPLLTGTGDLEAGTAQLAAAGPGLILVTLGAKGAFYRRREETGTVPGVPCKVGDTNGAGDTFFGAFLSRLSNMAGEPDRSQLERAIAFANRAASLTTSRHGAIPAMPTLEEMGD